MGKIFSVVTVILSIAFQTSFAQFKVVGYLPTWNGYPSSINNVDLTKITHLDVAFANPDASGNLIMTGGTLANLATVVDACHAEGVKVLISIAGATASGTNYRDLIMNDQTNFVNKMVQFVLDNNLDGIDVDIEGNILNGTMLNATQYEGFIVELQTALHAENKLITAALANWFANHVTNLAASKFDFINIMSYDAKGTWTGAGEHSSYDLAASDLAYWRTTKGVPAANLTVGVPFYGYSWSPSGNSSVVYKNVVAAYTDAEFIDDQYTPTNAYINYNGIPTIKQKTMLALSEAGGIMIWELTGDATGAKSLLSAIDEVIQGAPTNNPPSGSITSPTDASTFTEGDTIDIEVTALDADGSIMKVEYYAGTIKLGQTVGGITTFRWTGAGAGTYTITAKITDNIGESTITAGISVTVNAAASSLPYTGEPISIPGKIQAENFNLGGNNVAYNDNTVENTGGAYRVGRVDIEICSDLQFGYNVGWTETNEWLEYDVDVATTGLYDLKFRIASNESNRTLSMFVDGTNVTGNVAITNTGGWQKWQTVTKQGVSLTEGLHTFKMNFNNGGCNFNFVEVITSTGTSVLHTSLNTNESIVFPNPCQSNAIVKFTSAYSAQTKIQLFNQNGTMVKELLNTPLNAGTHEIPLSNLGTLPKGIYSCHIFSDKENKIIKLAIE